MNFHIVRETGRPDPELLREIALAHLRVPSEWTPGWQESREVTEPLLKSVLDRMREGWGQENHLILTARGEGDALVGYHWSTCPAPAKRIPGAPWTTVQILGTWVAKSWRKHGIATGFKTRVEAWAREMECDKITTQVDLANDTGIRELNEKLGYRPVRIVLEKRLENER